MDINLGKNGQVNQEKTTGYTGNTGYTGGFINTDGTQQNQQVQESASAYVGTANEFMGNGYVGGYVGNKIDQSASTGYVGGYVGEQSIGVSINGQSTYNENAKSSTENLPTKPTLWTKIKAVVLGKTSYLTKGKQLVLSEKEVTVLTQVHDFLFQDISFKGFMNILKIGNDKK